MYINLELNYYDYHTYFKIIIQKISRMFNFDKKKIQNGCQIKALFINTSGFERIKF